MLATRGLVVLAVLTFASVAVSAPAGMTWQKDLESACKLAAQTNRLVLVHFWGKSCPRCVEMDRVTLSKPEVAKELESTFVCVKVNAEQDVKLRTQYGIRSIPTDLVLTPDGKVVSGSVGFYPPAQYLERLNRIAASARNPGRSPSGVPGNPGTPSGTETGPDRSLVAAGVQPPYGSAPVDPRAAGGYSSPPGGESSPRGSAPAGRGAEQSPSAGGGRAIPPSDRQARWSAGSEAAQSRRADGSFASANGPAASAKSSAAEPESNRGPDRGQDRSQDRAADASVGVRRVNPPLDLEGYCAVSLVEHGRWVRGDRRYGVIHRGRTYLFAGPQEADRFYNNPDRYAPVLSGNDVVLYVDQGQSVPGRRAHGAVYEDRVYLFSSEASYEKFSQYPDRYIRVVTSPGKNVSRGADLRGDRRDPRSDAGVAREARDGRDSRFGRDDRNAQDARGAFDRRSVQDTRAGGDTAGESRLRRDVDAGPNERRSRDDRAMRDPDDARDEPSPGAGRRY